MKRIMLATLCMVVIASFAMAEGRQGGGPDLGAQVQPARKNDAPARYHAGQIQGKDRRAFQGPDHGAELREWHAVHPDRRSHCDDERGPGAVDPGVPGHVAVCPHRGHVRRPVRLHELRAHEEGLRQGFEGRGRLLQVDLREVQLHAPGRDDAGHADRQREKDDPDQDAGRHEGRDDADARRPRLARRGQVPRRERHRDRVLRDLHGPADRHGRRAGQPPARARGT